MPAELAGADLVVGCTGAVGTVLAATTVEEALPARAGRPLVLLDLALPRDFDGAAGVLPGVHYLDLAALQQPAIRLGAHRDVDRARQIIGEEVAGRLGARRATSVAPTVTALRARAAELVDAELARLDARLPGLDATARAEVARTVHRVVQTLLHAPTVRIKQLAERPGGDAYADALRELFDLDPAATAAVAAAVLRRREAAAMTEREGSQRERAATEAVRTGPPLRIGTRGSALARSQTETVIAALAGLGIKAEAVEIVTTGDRSTAALTQIGGTGVFVSALRDALLSGGSTSRSTRTRTCPRRRSRGWSSPRCRRARTRATCWSRGTGSPWPSCRSVRSSAPGRRAGPRRSSRSGSASRSCRSAATWTPGCAR